MKRFKIINIILLLVLVFLSVWGISILRCEILTMIYGNEFDKIYQENIELGDLEYLKVIEYTEEQARVYYVSNNCMSGDVLTFTKENGVWKYESWETIWSTTGSADDFIWPYCWHFFYAHPKLT